MLYTVLYPGRGGKQGILKLNNIQILEFGTLTYFIYVNISGK